jgi:gluconokinase
VIVVVIGVAGCGKTTIGAGLAKALGWKFYDADDFHPLANVAKMSQGLPLDDNDREPWLASLNRQLLSCAQLGESAVLACSALKQVYRERLARGLDGLRWVYLRGDFATIQKRLLERPGHYMKAGLLESQYQILEEPAHAIVLDVAEPPEAIIERLLSALKPG